MAKLTDIKYVIRGRNGREEITLYTTKEEAGDMCKGFKLPDGTRAYVAIGETTSKLATQKRFKIQGKVYAALREAEAKKDKIRKAYIFKAGSHKFKVPFWAKKVHYTICSAGSGIISTNAPILDLIDQDGFEDKSHIVFPVNKRNFSMTIPNAGYYIAGSGTSISVLTETTDEFGSSWNTDDTRSDITESFRDYNRNDHWLKTTDIGVKNSENIGVYQAYDSPYQFFTTFPKVDNTVTRKRVFIAPTMINPDITGGYDYDTIVDGINSNVPWPPGWDPEAEYKTINGTDKVKWTVYNKGFKALYNVCPTSAMVKIDNISKFINDTMAKYKVNLIDKDVYHDEDNSLMVNTFINQAYIYNTYKPFKTLYSSGVSVHSSSVNAPTKNDALVKSTYDAALSSYNAKPEELKNRYDNVTYYMRKQFLDGTIFDYDYMMQLKSAGNLDGMINSSMLSNMDLVDGAYNFATGRATSKKLSETRIGAREVVFDIMCQDNQNRQLSIKYGGSLLLGWDKYFDDAYCYDIEDIDIYKADEFTKIFNPLSGNLTMAPFPGQEKTGTWNVSGNEIISIEVGTHGLLYTEDMGFKLNKYFHDREADGICILELEGDFEDVAGITEALRFGNSLPNYKYNQLMELCPLTRSAYTKSIDLQYKSINGKYDLSSQDVFTYKNGMSNAFKEYIEESDDGENHIDLYMSSHEEQLTNMSNAAGSFELRMQGYDISNPENQSNLHSGLGAYENKVKMNMAEDFIAHLSSFINTENMVYQGIVPLRSYYTKERVFKFKNAAKLHFAFRHAVVSGQYIPRVKADYSKELDVYGLLSFDTANDLDYRWFVSLGLYINPATAKNIAVNMSGYINKPNGNKLRNTKIKIYKPWVSYDLSTGTVKYKVPKNATTKSLVGIIPTLDVGIRNVIIDITDIGDVAMGFSPVLATPYGTNTTITIIDNSGLTERKFSRAFAYTKSNIYGSLKFKPETMQQFAIGSSVDLSNIDIDTSNAVSFEDAFRDFRGKLPRNMDISKCLNFTRAFYNADFSMVTADVFKDGTFRATKLVDESMEISNTFVDFSGKDTILDVWKFLIDKVRLLEQIKARPTVNMSNFMAYLRGIPFFSLYDIYIAVTDTTFVKSRYSFGSGYMCSGCTFKEFEAPILLSSSKLYSNFTLNTIGINGVDKLTFIQPSSVTINTVEQLTSALTAPGYSSNLVNNGKSASNTNKIKLPTKITVKLRRDVTKFNVDATAIEAIKAALNTTYLTPKENISVIVE
jgi:hypothetical protein|nr:MAG TPA: hypothetical protein [Caudoviricetes sp.]